MKKQMSDNPINKLEIKATAQLEDTETGTRWGNASGPAIEPPEEEYKIATVEIHVDLNQLKAIDDGLQEGFDTTITDTTIEYNTETGELVIELTLEGYMTLRRTGALYERTTR